VLIWRELGAEAEVVIAFGRCNGVDKPRWRMFEMAVGGDGLKHFSVDAMNLRWAGW